jgi:hypothetical protein
MLRRPSQRPIEQDASFLPAERVQRLGNRQQRQPFRQRQARPPHRQALLGVGVPQPLRDKPCLPDPGVADDQQEPGTSVQRRPQPGQLGLTADENTRAGHAASLACTKRAPQQAEHNRQTSLELDQKLLISPGLGARGDGNTAARIALRLCSGSVPSVVSFLGSPLTAEMTTDTGPRPRTPRCPIQRQGWSSAPQAAARPDDLAAAEGDKLEVDAAKRRGHLTSLLCSTSADEASGEDRGRYVLPAELEASEISAVRRGRQTVGGLLIEE